MENNSEKVPPAFDRSLFEDRWHKGLTVKEIEYGVQYPDGNIEWASEITGNHNVHNEGERFRFYKNYEYLRNQTHQKNTGKLVFISRVVTKSFSKPEIITGFPERLR
jgi:hypothetical protein